MPVIMLLSSKRETFFVSFICIFASLVKINVGMILHILCKSLNNIAVQ